MIAPPSIPRWRSLALTAEERRRHFASGQFSLQAPPAPVDTSRKAATARVLAALAEYKALPVVRRGDLSFIAKKHDVSPEAMVNRLRAQDLMVRLNASKAKKMGVLLVCEVGRGQKSSDNFEPNSRRSA
jgi:hypothetical protein